MVLLACRLLLGGVFLVSGLAKLAAPARFADAAAEFTGLPRKVTGPAGFALLAVEMGSGVLLVTGFAVRWASIATAALLVGFTGLVGFNVAHDRSVPCACFGGVANAPVSRTELVRNLALLSVAITAAVLDSLPFQDQFSLLAGHPAVVDWLPGLVVAACVWLLVWSAATAATVWRAATRLLGEKATTR